MHHCLNVLDILDTIFNFVLESHEYGTSTLAALAVTCRHFEHPALDVLWRTIPSLIPLVKCLPPDLWEMTIQVETGRLLLVRTHATRF